MTAEKLEKKVGVTIGKLGHFFLFCRVKCGK